MNCINLNKDKKIIYFIININIKLNNIYCNLLFLMLQHIYKKKKNGFNKIFKFYNIVKLLKPLSMLFF